MSERNILVRAVRRKGGEKKAGESPAFGDLHVKISASTLRIRAISKIGSGRPEWIPPNFPKT